MEASEPNYYAEAKEALRAIPRPIAPPVESAEVYADAQAKAAIAVAKSNLALFDMLYTLRGDLESISAKLSK